MLRPSMLPTKPIETTFVCVTPVTGVPGSPVVLPGVEAPGVELGNEWPGPPGCEVDVLLAAEASPVRESQAAMTTADTAAGEIRATPTEIRIPKGPRHHFVLASPIMTQFALPTAIRIQAG